MIINTVFIMAGGLSLYIFQCHVSILYFVNKYNINKQDLIEFLESSPSILQSLFKKSENYSVIERFYVDPKRYRMIYARVLFAFLMILIPMRVVYDILITDLVSNRIILIIYLIAHAICFYVSWRFGHSLKSKAQK